MNELNELQARRWLSEARYRRFRDACGGDHESTARFYEWHAVLCMASYGLFHHFEVLFRNAIDGTLGEGQLQAPIKDTWLLDFDTLRPDGIRQVITAIDRIERRRDVTRGRVVARRVQRFRNRIAHHDSLLDQDVPALVEDMLVLASWIDPRARSWLEAQTGAVEIAHQLSRLTDLAASPA